MGGHAPQGQGEQSRGMGHTRIIRILINASNSERERKKAGRERKRHNINFTSILAFDVSCGFSLPSKYLIVLIIIN